MKQLTINDIKFVAFEMARRMMTWDEPIPDFGTRFPNILESCLAAPFQTFSKRSLYGGLNYKASVLFYLMIKNHPFQNGNKRIAVMALLTLLYLNNKWIKVSNEELYNFAVWVATSPPQAKDHVIEAIKGFVDKNIIETG